MTDAALDPDIFSDDELVFDDEPIAPPAPAKKPRKKAAAKAEAAAPVADTAPEPVAPAADLDFAIADFDDAPAPAAAPTTAPEAAADLDLSMPDFGDLTPPPLPIPATPEPAPAAEADPAPVKPARAHDRLLIAIVALALLSSLMSLGGLIAVSRTLGAAQAERSKAEEERAALARAPAMIAALDHAAARLAAAAPGASVSAAPAAPGAALTADELHRSLDALRVAMDSRQPTGLAAMSGTMNASFSELATRLDRIEDRLDQTQRTPGRGR